ncbi:MAG: ABC transporter substrate-binding protein [Rhodocyclales bacterium]|nr:ABC transporter substrate-binding protein [Rhodocyclales bacterium]
MKRQLARLALACLLLMQGALHAAETGVTDNAILIGQSAAFSGPAQELGLEMRQGAKLVFDSVNAQGGIHGRKIQLVAHDDGYEPERAAANTRKLIDEDRVFALFGYVGTPTSQASLPIFTEAKVPFIGAFTGAQLLREPFNRNIFNVRASYFDETEKIIEQLVSLGAKTIAVFYQNDAYGKAGLAGVERALAKRDMKIAATATVERNTVDVAAAVRTINPTRPDAVVMISAYKSVAAFVKEMKKAGSTTQFHNVSFVGSRPLAKELGADGPGVAVSQVVPFPWGASVPVTRDYQRMMNASGAKEYSFTSLEGFIAARILVEGMKRAGKDLTREKLISALEGMNNADLGGFQVAFSPKNHNASSYVDLTMIGKNGQFLR